METYLSRNPVIYLQNFIETYLVITEVEKEVLQHLAEATLSKKSLKTIGKKRCKVCGRVLPQEDFYKHMASCKECYNKSRTRPKKPKKRKVSKRRKRRCVRTTNRT